MEITVNRLWQGADDAAHRASTTGVLAIDGKQTCFTLENTALMIPTGTYPIKLEWSNRFQRKTPHLQDVPGRTAIECHGGNEAEDSEGCILLAEKRMSNWFIHESKPATDTIESSLAQAEANSEVNTITIT